MKALTKYPGSKWGIADRIISFFPDHHSYLEPFFGSGAVFFKKSPSNIETINDLDGNVVNLFECIRKDPERLAREIELLPYAREVYDRAFLADPEDTFERALYFLIRLNMGHGYRTNGQKVGWKNDVHGRERAYAVQDWNYLPERIIEAAARLKNAQIEHMDAIKLITRFNYDNVLIYCDPPYLLSTRYGQQYSYELDDTRHKELLDVLIAHKGPVIISGYDNEIYNERLCDWYREEIKDYCHTAKNNKEILWMNYTPPNYSKQLLLDFGNE